jgi:hypothetical protein
MHDRQRRLVLRPRKYAVAGLVEILDGVFEGGIEAIPYSWPYDLTRAVVDEKSSEASQIRLHLN